MGKKKRIQKLKSKVKRLKAALAATEAAGKSAAAKSKAVETAAPESASVDAPAPKTKKAHAISPFAPERFPAMAPVPGVRLAGAAAGVRYKGRLDVMLAVAEAGSAVAGVFTTSKTRSAPVLWCQQALSRRSAEGGAGQVAILVNSGNSNAFTGAAGARSVSAAVDSVAQALGVGREDVLMASTGVIGEPLPHERIINVIDALVAGLDGRAWEPATRAIMTTDTYPKGYSARFEIDGVPVTISGFAKGSGMIAPDMATMLAFVFTDANIDSATLQAILSSATLRSFNAITVDGDTSTSDTLIAVASRKAPHAPIVSAASAAGAAFAAAFETALRDLALQVVKDGEGAQKLVEIRVTGAEDEQAARTIGMAIANSPLVKTAIAGEDPNWGRVVMAVGKSGEAADRDRLSIWFGDILVAENGAISPTYKEDDGAAYMKGRELTMRVDVGVGDGSAAVWTCDLTHAYIDINADYRS